MDILDENVYAKAKVYRTTRLTDSYWPATSEKVLLESTIGQELRSAAVEYPDRIAMIEGIPEFTKRRRWTYAQMLVDAERVARALLSRYKPGDKIALWGDNIPEWVLTQMGIALAGMVMVTLNPAYKKREAHYQLEQSDSVALFCIDEYRRHDVLTTAKKLCQEILTLKDVFRFAELELFMSSGSESITLPKVKPEDIATIVYTSGTTGKPKGAMLYHGSIVNGIHFMTERGGIEMGAIWMNAMPCFHFGGSGYGVIGNLMRRSTNVLVRTFEPLSFLELCDSENATFVFAVPAMIEMLLANYDPQKHNLRLMSMGR